MTNLLTASVEELQNMEFGELLNYASQASGQSVPHILTVAIIKVIICYGLIWAFRKVATKEIEKFEDKKPGLAFCCYILVLIICVFIWFAI